MADAVAGTMSGAEVVLLNFHCPGAALLSTQQSQGVPGARVLAYPARLDGLTSGGAYLITQEACRRIQGMALPIRAYSDDWKFFVSLGALDRLRCVAPIPVTNSPLFRTTIDYYPHRIVQRRLREMIGQTRLPVLHQWLVARRLREYDKRGWLGRSVMVDRPPATGMGAQPA